MMNPFIAAIAAEGAASGATTLDFSEALTNALNGVSAGFGKYVLIAIPIGLGIWAGPKAIKLVMKFFNALTH